jgi:ABC-type lipoprotein export system ATPase subunit
MLPLQYQHITCRSPAWNGRTQRAVEDFSKSFASESTTAFHGGYSSKAALLLSIPGMIKPPDSAWIGVLGESVLTMETSAAHQSRDTAFGFLCTHPHLLPSFSVAENIAAPCLRLCGKSIDAARKRVAEVFHMSEINASRANLARCILDEAAHWRVPFAHSIAHHPKILVTVSPPALLLLPQAKRYDQQTGAAALWTAGSLDATRMCDRILHPGSAKTSTVVI